MKAAATLNFRSFCILGDAAECCIISPDGQPYGNSPICLEGVCSHKMPEFESINLRKQYFFCNLTSTIANNDPSICGIQSLITLSNQTKSPSRALKVFFDPTSKVNTTKPATN